MTEPTVHLTADTLRTYLGAGQVTTLRLTSSPDCRLQIEPAHQTLALWTPAEGAEPHVTAMSRLSFDREDLDGLDWFVLEVDARDLPYEAYSLLAAIVDDMSAGHGFAQATARAVASYKDLLAHRPRMSRSQADGLIGELLLVEQLIKVIGEAAAVEAWLGPGRSEHDFSLAGQDAEVKTTTGETRTHMIGSATQLQPSPGRPLWLVSIQITKAGIAANGFGLPSLVVRIKGLLASGRERFVQYLSEVGWRDADSDLYPELYVLRSVPVAFFVDADFPAITQSRINDVVPNPSLIVQINYRIDLSTLTPSAPHGDLGAALAGFPADVTEVQP